MQISLQCVQIHLNLFNDVQINYSALLLFEYYYEQSVIISTNTIKFTSINESKFYNMSSKYNNCYKCFLFY